MDAQQLRDRLAALVAEYDASQPPLEAPHLTSGLQAALDAAPAGSTLRLHYEAVFVGNFVVRQSVTLIGAAALVSPNSVPALRIDGDDVTVRGCTIQSQNGAQTNDLVVIRGARTVLDQVHIQGNGATKRGVAANGTNALLVDTNVLRIGRLGQESQAVAIWDGTGLTLRRCVLEAGSIPFLSGGSSPTVPNHVPADILIEDCLLTHPLDWRGAGYVNKTGLELKSARRVVVRRSTIENCWKDGQDGWGITLTPSQYGNSPETIVEDVLIDECTVREVGGGANILGFTQHTDRPTLRAHTIRFAGNTFVISRAANGGHGSLMQLGRGPADVQWENNIVTQDGDAFLRTSDASPVTGFAFRGNRVDVAGTYGVWTPIGARGTRFAEVFPNAVVKGNTFVGAHATFRTAFPENTWVV